MPVSSLSFCSSAWTLAISWSSRASGRGGCGAARLGAPGGEIGEGGGQLAEQRSARKRRFRLGNAVVNAGALFTRDVISSFNSASSVSSRWSATSASDVCCCSRAISAANCVSRGRARRRVLGALFLAVELSRALVSRCSPAAARARARAAPAVGGADRLDAGGLGLLAGAFGHLANGCRGYAGFRDVGIGLHPAQVERRRLGLRILAATSRKRMAWRACFFRPSIWPASCPITSSTRARFSSAAFSSQLGFVAARMQAGDAGRLFEHAAARSAAWPRSARRSGPGRPSPASARRSRRRRTGAARRGRARRGR